MRRASSGFGPRQIGDEGARALKGLTALTSLDLNRNGIGDEGARALTGLTALSSLVLSENRIGADGARALKGLTVFRRAKLPPRIASSANVTQMAPSVLTTRNRPIG